MCALACPRQRLIEIDSVAVTVCGRGPDLPSPFRLARPVMTNSALSFRRWAVILAAALSGILVLMSMFADPVPDADGRELIQGYAANEGRQGLHTNLIHYGFALFAPVAYAMVGLVRRRGVWIANVAGLLAVLGLSTLPGLVLTDYMLVGVEHVAGLDAASDASAATENLPGFTALGVPAILASVLAVPVATLALWRAGLVRWWLPVVAVATFLAPNLLPGWLIGFSVMAAGMLTVWRGHYRVYRRISGTLGVVLREHLQRQGRRAGHRRDPCRKRAGRAW